MLHTASNPSPLLVPTLQNATWTGHGFAVHQPLVNGPSKWIPTLTFADDAPTMRQLRTEGDPEALREKASANLRKLPYQLGVMKDEGPPFPMAVIEGHEYAAEQVLNPEAMRRVAHQLGARNLVVGVPRRGVLVAVDAELPKEQMSFFLHFVSAQFFRANTGAISPVGLLVYDGIVCGVAAGMEESGRADAEAVPEVPIAVEVSETPGVAGSPDVVSLQISGPDLEQVSAPAMSTLMRSLIVRKLSGNTAPVEVHLHLSGMPMAEHAVSGFSGYVEQTIRSQSTAVPPLDRIRVFVDGEERTSVTDGLPPELLQHLGLAPFAVLVMVAGADGELEQSEIEAFRERLMQAHPLFLVGLQRNGITMEEAIAKLLQNGQLMLGVLARTGELCRAHAPDRAEALIGELLTLSETIADSRTGGSGDDEQRAVAMVRALLSGQGR